MGEPELGDAGDLDRSGLSHGERAELAQRFDLGADPLPAAPVPETVELHHQDRLVEPEVVLRGQSPEDHQAGIEGQVV